MQQWNLIERGSAGAFGVEVYRARSFEGTTHRYFVKVYIYDKVVKLSGDKEIIKRKLEQVISAFAGALDAIEEDAIKKDK